MTQRTEIIMGMPITIDLADGGGDTRFETAFARFREIDRRFSPYRDDSELAAFNAGRIGEDHLSDEFRLILQLAGEARLRTAGYFDIIRPDGKTDPSGVVKAWAIREVARLLSDSGEANFCVDAGGDVQAAGRTAEGRPWRVGIRNPFAIDKIVKVICPGARGVATSGSYIRGHHIYDPVNPGRVLDDIVSLTVVAGDVLEADILATAAFAMGREGLDFLRRLSDVEAYAIDRHGIATFTAGFTSLATT